ncbi:hypothetical protein [Herbaspirillum frisingense]|uniref:hypothetical protein n=1 Tax=Herbaspirillum frisingense TaxID=92645 RepID=UPI0039B027F0
MLRALLSPENGPAPFHAAPIKARANIFLLPNDDVKNPLFRAAAFGAGPALHQQNQAAVRILTDEHISPLQGRYALTVCKNLIFDQSFALQNRKLLNSRQTTT